MPVPNVSVDSLQSIVFRTDSGKMPLDCHPAWSSSLAQSDTRSIDLLLSIRPVSTTDDEVAVNERDHHQDTSFPPRVTSSIHRVDFGGRMRGGPEGLWSRDLFVHPANYPMNPPLLGRWLPPARVPGQRDDCSDSHDAGYPAGKVKTAQLKTKVAWFGANAGQRSTLSRRLDRLEILG